MLRCVCVCVCVSDALKKENKLLSISSDLPLYLCLFICLSLVTQRGSRGSASSWLCSIAADTHTHTHTHTHKQTHTNTLILPALHRLQRLCGASVSVCVGSSHKNTKLGTARSFCFSMVQCRYLQPI